MKIAQFAIAATSVNAGLVPQINGFQSDFNITSDEFWAYDQLAYEEPTYEGSGVMDNIEITEVSSDIGPTIHLIETVDENKGWWSSMINSSLFSPVRKFWDWCGNG